MNLHRRGIHLKRWREVHGHSLHGLANRVGLDPSYLRRFEQGLRPVSLGAAIALRKETGIALRQLMALEEWQKLREACRLEFGMVDRNATKPPEGGRA